MRDAAEPGGRHEGYGQRPASDGLYAVWGNYLRLLSRKGRRGTEKSLYLEAISEVGGADTAAWLRNAVATPRWRAD